MIRNVPTLASYCVIAALVSCRVGYDSIDSEVSAGAAGRTGAGGTPFNDGGNVGAGADGGTQDQGGTGASEGGTSGTSATGGEEAAGSSGIADAGAGTNGGGGSTAGAGAGTSGASGGTSGSGAGTSGASGGTSSVGGTAGSGGVAPGCAASGTTYVICPTGSTHDGATTTCASMGMRLIRVDSASENDWLLTAPGTDVWLGASDVAAEGEWRWADGELFWLGESDGSPQNGLYTAWNPLAPTKSPPAADCAKLDSMARTWIDVLCNSVFPFVCEAY